VVLSILPSWHAYERTCEYFLFAQACTQIYTSIRHIKKDLGIYKPQLMVGVPRIWESIYEGVQKTFREQPPTQQKLVNFFLQSSRAYIQGQRLLNNLSLHDPRPTGAQKLKAKLTSLWAKPIHDLATKKVYGKIKQVTGGKLKALVSGGGSLARHIDDFYEIVGIPILVGYGLTETSPVTNVRQYDHNLRGSSGPALPGTEIRIVNPETRADLPQGDRGLVLIRGPQVMQGYYKKPEATAKAIDPEGWFDSGDLGYLTPAQDLVITGRAKDTIVLSNGENIEPQPIEDACTRSSFIDQMMVVGQDQKCLGALVVPNLENLELWVKNEGLTVDLTSPEALNQNPAIINLIKAEITKEIQNRPGYRPDDRIGQFTLLVEGFSIENGMMTQTMKIKRPVVSERYQAMINGMFS
jgi:long-chain acyl-CoA synthetase